jgi:hypothetical protein
MAAIQSQVRTRNIATVTPRCKMPSFKTAVVLPPGRGVDPRRQRSVKSASAMNAPQSFCKAEQAVRC